VLPRCGRGHWRVLHGRFEGRPASASSFLAQIDSAEADFSAALRIDPNDSYSAIWLYVAQSRSGRGTAAVWELVQNAARLDGASWPAPTVDFLEGTTDSEGLLTVAARGDEKTQREQLCEAVLCAGELHLLQGRQREARTFLERAQRDCPKDLLEHFSASAELKRLAQ